MSAPLSEGLTFWGKLAIDSFFYAKYPVSDMQRFRGTLVVGISCAVFVLAAGFFARVPIAHAFDFDTLRGRFEGRLNRMIIPGDDAENKDSETKADPEEQSTQSTQVEEGGQANACECSARLAFSRPDVHWQNGTLQFIPRFDLRIRVDQEDNALPWKLALHYSGTAHNTAFSGLREFGGQCLDGRYEYTGLAVSPISMTDVIRSLFGSNDEQELHIRMAAAVSGCDNDEESEQVEVEIEEFGNLDVGRWRRAR